MSQVPVQRRVEAGVPEHATKRGVWQKHRLAVRRSRHFQVHTASKRVSRAVVHEERVSPTHDVHKLARIALGVEAELVHVSRDGDIVQP